MKASFGNYFLCALTIGEHQSLCFVENKGISRPPHPLTPFSFLLFFSFFLFVSNQLSTDHPSHFSLCPRILRTIVLIPSVLSIKALVILLRTAGRSDSTHRHSFCGTVWLQLRWGCAYFEFLPANAFRRVPQGCVAECPDATNSTTRWDRPGLRQ